MKAKRILTKVVSILVVFAILNVNKNDTKPMRVLYHPVV